MPETIPTAQRSLGMSQMMNGFSFVPLEPAVWPHLEERVAQIFEDPNSPDMAHALVTYSRGGVGSHGGMSLAQSRASSPVEWARPQPGPARHRRPAH